MRQGGYCSVCRKIVGATSGGLCQHCLTELQAAPPQCTIELRCPNCKLPADGGYQRGGSTHYYCYGCRSTFTASNERTI